jgi:hypothetical protein
VQTLGQMSTRSHTQVNKYFTAAEVIEGIVDIEAELGVEDNDSKPCFDTSDEEDDEFNNAIDGDVDQDDENM